MQNPAGAAAKPRAQRPGGAHRPPRAPRCGTSARSPASTLGATSQPRGNLQVQTPPRAHAAPPAPLTLHAQPAGAEHTCYQSGHIPNHSTTGPRCAASSARRAARPGRGGAGRAGAGFPGPPRGWPGRRSGSGPTAGRRRCAHLAATAAVALHLPPPLGAARSLACAL